MNDNPCQGQDTTPVDEGRRRFCQFAIGGMALASVATVGYPIVTFLKLPASMQQEESVEVPLSSLSADAAKWVERLGQQIVIIKTEGGARAFNGSCPHLGCIVQWDSTTRAFRCPCHGAVFNDKGEPVAGPVNAPLKRVAFVVKDGILKIT